MISKKTTTADGTTARPTYGYPGCDQLAAPAEKPGRPPGSYSASVIGLLRHGLNLLVTRSLRARCRAASRGFR